MIDLSFIGKDGLVIQYEDLISLMGYNVLCAMKDRNDVLKRMSDKDILLGYVNRTIENPSDYIRDTYGIQFPLDKMYQSPKTLRPNLTYAYRMFDTAYRNGIRKLYVYSSKYSEAIENYIKAVFVGFPVQYIHGEILPVLQGLVNATFVTSNTHVIRSCTETKTPLALMIVDDFMYVAPIIEENLADKLRENNIFVGFTGVLSAGVIP